MSDQSKFPDFQEFVKAEGNLLTDALSGKYGLVDSIENVGIAAGFAILWPGITALDKVFGPYNPKSDTPSHLDMNAHPVRGIDLPVK